MDSASAPLPPSRYPVSKQQCPSQSSPCSAAGDPRILKQLDELVADQVEQDRPAHDAAANHHGFRREEQRDVEAELREVEGDEAPHLRVVGDVGQHGEVNVESLPDGLVADHDLQASLVLVEGTLPGSARTFGRALHHDVRPQVRQSVDAPALRDLAHSLARPDGHIGQ
jgi:hypothetical protein